MQNKINSRHPANRDNNIALLVVSCDAYKDLWRPFFHCLFKYWPDCPYNVYLGTNNLDIEDKRVKVLKIGKYVSWTDNVKKMIDAIPEAFILLFLEDYLLAGQVNTFEIERLFSLVLKDEIKCLKLFDPSQQKKLSNRENGLAMISAKDAYCVNTAIAIWCKKTLVSLLKPGYSPWQFEFQNSYDCQCANKLPGKFSVTYASPFIIIHGIFGGKWSRKAEKHCIINGISIDKTKRGVMTIREILQLKIKKILSGNLPDKGRIMLKKALIRIGFKNFTSPY